MLNSLSAQELVRVAAAGGGFEIAGSEYSVDDLARIASAAGMTGAQITITGTAALNVDQMVRIAAAGQSCVTFST